MVCTCEICNNETIAHIMTILFAHFTNMTKSCTVRKYIYLLKSFICVEISKDGLLVVLRPVLSFTTAITCSHVTSCDIAYVCSYSKCINNVHCTAVILNSTVCMTKNFEFTHLHMLVRMYVCSEI